MKIKRIAGILLLMTFMTWGCTQSDAGDKKVTNAKEQVKAPAQQTTSAGETDSHGRKSGDAHFGHNHSPSEGHSAPSTNSAQPANGEPDKFGRKPGDPHYGHNHE